MHINKQRLIFGLYLLVPIAAAEMVSLHFKLPAWPAFLAMIFFFLGEMDVKKVPEILIGGFFGIAFILLAAPIIGALAPSMGLELATTVFVLILVFAIIVLGEALPKVFNNYAFTYLTVTGVAVKVTETKPNPFLWMAIGVVGGALLIASVIGIGKLMQLQAGAKQASAPGT